MKRGDIYLAAMTGDYGKPRPVIVIQTDLAEDIDSRVVCPLTTFEEPAAFFRPVVDPTPQNGLQQRSFVMVEKLGPISSRGFRDQIGRVTKDELAQIGQSLAVLLGLV